MNAPGPMLSLSRFALHPADSADLHVDHDLGLAASGLSPLSLYSPTQVAPLTSDPLDPPRVEPRPPDDFR